MGAGKTTLGKKLAARLGYKFIDLDQAVITSQNMESVTALVEQRGFEYFRQAESDTLKQLDAAHAVIATGGGTPCYFNNLEWMKQQGIVVYIELDEKTLFNRIQQTNLHERPLLKDLDNEALQQFIHEKLRERLPYYSQAQVIYNPLRQSVDELVRILQPLV